MRVITGSKRGRKLKTLDGDSVRPTTDKVKESLFNIIQFDIEGRRVLDLFSGSGQLGIEALSRGAASAVFVDSSKASLDVTKENLISTGLVEVSKTVLMDALVFLDRALEQFDLALLDPPYKAGLMEELLNRLPPHMSDGAVIVCETSADEVLPEQIPCGFASKRYKYGKIALTVYRKGE